MNAPKPVIVTDSYARTWDDLVRAGKSPRDYVIVRDVQGLRGRSGEVYGLWHWSGSMEAYALFAEFCERRWQGRIIDMGSPL